MLQQIFYQGVNSEMRTKINNFTNYGYLEMDPQVAWEQLDKVTNYDTLYDPPTTTTSQGLGRGLYQIPTEVDKDVRAQYQADEANRLKRQVSSLKACQLCQSSSHIASSCPNMHQVHAAEGYLTEEVNFTKDVYRNPNSSYQPKNVGYPNWDAYTKGERGPPTNHGYQPYLPPNYQEPRQAPPANNDDLRRLMLEISKHNDQRLDVIQQAQA